METQERAKGKGTPSPADILAYAKKNIAGKNVQDPQSPLRIVENIDLPFEERDISFNALGGTVKNSIGVASLTEEVDGVESIDQARLILRREAERLGITSEQLLNPKNISRHMKKSPLLRKVLRFFE